MRGCTTQWVCVRPGRVSLRVTASGCVSVWQGYFRKIVHSGRGVRSASFLLSVSTFQSQPGCLPQPLRQPGLQACRPPPLFLIPASQGVRRLEEAPWPPPFWGVGAGKGPVLLRVGDGPAPGFSWGMQQASDIPGGCLRDFIKERGGSFSLH